MRHTSRPRTGALFLAIVLLTGCAAVEPQIRVDFDRTADFSAFRSYGFPAELGTDRGGYSTLITGYFKQAVDREMQQRGYTYSGTDPDLLVNFFARARDVTDVRSQPVVWVGHGYYGYRYGLYGAWPLYADGVSTVHYKVGTANVDVVDARRRQLIWEGVAEGKLTPEAMRDPQAAIADVVAELFKRYPGRAAPVARPLADAVAP
jgi:hypothetical protein